MNGSKGPLLSQHARLTVKQSHELGEWFGFETRNKYEVLSSTGQALAFAAEQGKGAIAFFMRQYLGHWRSFELHFFTNDRLEFMRAVHPFRWYFQELEVDDGQGRKLGRIVKRFSILSKKFEILDSADRTILSVSSPIWKIWTFPFKQQGREVAVVKKNWSGLVLEALTDKDTFSIDVLDSQLNEETRRLLLASALYIDLIYFEKKAGR